MATFTIVSRASYCRSCGDFQDPGAVRITESIMGDGDYHGVIDGHFHPSECCPWLKRIR